MAASLSYSPWGEEELATESLPGYGDRFERPHYGYNAEQSSPEGGLQYLRARWYDPSMGAFGSRDSLLGDAADPATLNRYAYAEGNPVASCDPTGHVKAYKNRLSSQRATQRRARASGSRRTTSAKKTSVFAKVSAAVARFVSPLVKAPPLKKMTKELSYATNRTFSRLPPAPAASVVAVGAGAALRNVYYGGGKGGGGPGGFSPGTARTVALTASAVRARNYAAAARAAFCGTAARIGESKAQGVGLAAIGHGALDLLGFIPGIAAAADVANGLWYAAEGNYVDAAMSFVSAIPGVGDAFGGANAARKAVKAGLSAFEKAAPAPKVVQVLKQSKSSSIRAELRDDGVVDLVLKRKDVWDEVQMSQATRKARDLSRADTVKTAAGKRGPSASQTYKGINGKDSVPPGYDVDHIVDLQLGGADHVRNMRPLDASVNRSMGAQISYLIRDLPEGTRIGNVRFE
ncbi:RHS repeat-associated core domain-containing protein [Adlercreutzia equolifaciens]|uniref:RHS repeat-associated core domain-containing protein n=1 Tax=Adlercreutzia equolifaciens TaxID=446660 RepID=UPI0022E2DA47|nr:RHS repeat-associated core domain-containing protein [Adlercreutzia equolifaciens]